MAKGARSKHVRKYKGYKSKFLQNTLFTDRLKKIAPITIQNSSGSIQFQQSVDYTQPLNAFRHPNTEFAVFPQKKIQKHLDLRATNIKPFEEMFKIKTKRRNQRVQLRTTEDLDSAIIDNLDKLDFGIVQETKNEQKQTDQQNQDFSNITSQLDSMILQGQEKNSQMQIDQTQSKSKKNKKQKCKKLKRLTRFK